MDPDIERILQWPRETRSATEARQVVEYRAGLHRRMFALAAEAERADRGLTADERDEFDRTWIEFDRLAGELPIPR